jgi:hypothetical protein
MPSAEEERIMSHRLPGTLAGTLFLAPTLSRADEPAKASKPPLG